jgi:peptide-methionine (S)-S-oxide reductase
MLFNRAKTELVAPERALKGRDHYEFAIPATHYVKGTPLQPPFPEGLATVVFGLGCFWGAEEILWQTPGVYTTAVGYAGGYTEHPSYEEVCTGLTGHTEAVLVVYDPAVVSFEELVAIFFEVHDPTQGNRQGNDIGSQYRSAVYYTDDSQRADRRFFLRRGLPPAVPGQEPERLPLPRRHRHPVPAGSARLGSVRA